MLFMDYAPKIGDIAGWFQIYFKNYIPVLVLLVLLGIATYTDIKERKIKNWLNLLIVIARAAFIPLMGISYHNILGAAFLFGLFLAIAVIRDESMAGDIKCVGAFGFYLGLTNAVIVLFGAMIIALIFSIIRRLLKKDKYFPLAPFFLFSYAGIAGVYYIYDAVALVAG